MSYFAILLPVCVFNTKMNICCTTYFKVLRMERRLLIVNVVTAVLSVALSALAIWLLGSVEIALVGTVTCIAVRSFWCERFFDEVLGVEHGFSPVAEIVLTGVFIALALNFDSLIAPGFYLITYALHLVLNRKVVASAIGALSKSGA